MKKNILKLRHMKLNMKFTLLVIAVVLIPIGLMAGIIYYNMEQGVVRENLTSMEYGMERNITQFSINLDAINMSTQFTLSDEKMKEALNLAITGQSMSTEELLQFYNTDIASLERLINNNPLLYSIRVYAANDNIQEMMPVLYTHSRMEKLSWEAESDVEGWHFSYYDSLFSPLTTSQSEPIMSLVTPIDDYTNGRLGVVEVAMRMQTMFPSLYEDRENEWSCFVDKDGTLFYGYEKTEDAFMASELMMEHNDSFGEQENITTFYKKNKSGKYVVSYVRVKELEGTLVSVRNISSDLSSVYHSRNIFVIVAIITLMVMALFINYIVNAMLKQFYEILKNIRKVQEGDLDTRIEIISDDEMGELSSQLNTMFDRIQKLMTDNINREVLTKNAEIRALQNQINAHFIYNVLENIKMMAEIDEEYAISDAITALGKLLRYSMKWVSSNVRVRDELEYIRSYMTLINLRYDYEVILSINIPEELLDQEIPKMSLQPIVENAIIHGIEEVAADTTIYIKGFLQEGDCIIEITDSGQGMTTEQVDALRMKIAGQIETEGGSGNGIGLKNVQDRIVMAFGEEYGLDIVSRIDCFTKVIVHLPYKISEQSKP